MNRFVLKEDKVIHGLYSVSYPCVFTKKRKKYYFNGDLEKLIQHLKKDIKELCQLYLESRDFFAQYPEEFTKERERDLDLILEHNDVLVDLVEFLKHKRLMELKHK